MPRLALLTALALLLPSLPAHADGQAPGLTEPLAPAPVAKTHVQHYGLHVFLADAGWVAATVLLARVGNGSDSASHAASTIGSLGYLGAGALVHLAHHNVRGAMESLAVRGLLPAAGMLVGVSVYHPGGGLDALGGMIIGGAIGMGAALVVDWTVLAHREIVDGPSPTGLASIRPTLAIDRHQVGLALGGEF